ncbi:unnamed protein product [Brassica oleracea]
MTLLLGGVVYKESSCRNMIWGCLLSNIAMVYCELFSVKPNLKEQFIGYANFYWALSLAITVVSLFVTSG